MSIYYLRGKDYLFVDALNIYFWVPYYSFDPHACTADSICVGMSNLRVKFGHSDMSLCDWSPSTSWPSLFWIALSISSSVCILSCKSVGHIALSCCLCVLCFLDSVNCWVWVQIAFPAPSSLQIEATCAAMVCEFEFEATNPASLI